MILLAHVLVACAAWDARPASAQAIPVPEIAERAEQIAALVRGTGQGPSTTDVEGIESELAAADQWTRGHLVSTAQVLASSPSPNALAILADSWQVVRRRLTAWNGTLTARATLLEHRVNELETMRTTWSATRKSAVDSRAPTPVLARVDDTRVVIATARRTADERRAHVLELQDKVAKAIARCDDALAHIAQARAAMAGPLLARDSLPIWSREARARVSADPGGRLRGSVRDIVELTRDFLASQRGRVPLQLALFVIVAVLARRARTAARRRADKAPSEYAASQVFEVPISSALVLALLATAWIYADPPRVLTSVVGLLVLLPVVLVVRRLVSPAVVPAVHALAAFFLIDRVVDVCSVVPVLEQWVFLLEMMSGIVFLTLVARSERVLVDAADPAALGWRRRLAWILWAQLSVLVAAVGAGALGSMRLARLLGGTVLASDYVALVLYAGVRVADGLIVYVLRARPLNRLFMVQRHRALLERRITLALRWLAVGIWISFTLGALGVMDPFRSAAGTAWDARYVRGSISLSFGDVVVFILTVACAFALSAVVRLVLHEDVYPRLLLPRGVPYAASFFLHYAIVLGGFVAAVAAMGVDFTRITILAGALGVGVGIGLQGVVANFVSGLILLLERRIHVGDAIQLGDLGGAVREIGSRASTIRTWDGAEVIVPNSILTSERVTNWTLSDRLRRVDLDVRVDYASDPEHVLEILRTTGGAHPKALAEPAPVALCTGFADSALNFELRVWTAHAEEAESIGSQIAVAVHGALGAAKIAFAIPQRDVQLRRDGV